ncbi:MAG: carbamate kinase [Mycoplasma sp.]
MSIIVIALGGNALGNNPTEQKELVKIPAQKIASLIKEGHQVVVGHGNGPQIGMIFNSFSNESVIKENKFTIPFPEAGGMSQGYIGYHLQNALYNELEKIGLNNEVSYLLTQTLVDKNDKAFLNPTKPVGPFFKTKEEAELANPNSTIVEDAGRGFRKVVASPLPTGFLGMNSIANAVKNNTTVIVGGGGGIPTIKTENGYEGVDGVIDKDFALSLMAANLKADQLIILTAVSKVAINWGKENQEWISEMTVAEAHKHIADKQFAPGSMLPKVEAAIEFVKANPNGKAIIADLREVEEAIKGTTGTIIKA